jgi:ubiquinone/menaquinone biosynthesis C-methylase UbiE
LKEYYDQRAPEYDETSYGAAEDEEARELEQLQAAVASLPSGRTLDVACGTGYFTRHLQGNVVGLDQSAGMLRIVRRRLPTTPLIRGEARALPFRDSSFDRVFTSLFYGHLEEGDRRQFLKEARRVARQMVVVEERLREGLAAEGWEERFLTNGNRHLVYKRYFRPQRLARELGGTEIDFPGKRFVMALAGSPAGPS